MLEHAVQTGLGQDRRVGVVEVLEQVLLYGADVVDRLGHHPRDFLEAGETVEFQRVETGVLRIGLGFARLHLRFGLNFDIAQLPAKADDVFGEVEQRILEAAHFALDPRARDRQFAGLVDQMVDEVGADAQGCPLCGRIAFAVGEALAAGAPLRMGCSQLFGNALCGDRGAALRRGGRGRCWRRGGLRRGGSRFLFERFAALQTFDDVLHVVEDADNVFDDVRRYGTRSGGVGNPGFDGVRDFAEVHRAGHARAALERMQQARQRGDRRSIVRVIAPGLQLLGNALREILCFFEEDRQQLLVDLVLEVRHGGNQRRQPGSFLPDRFDNCCFRRRGNRRLAGRLGCFRGRVGFGNGAERRNDLGRIELVEVCDQAGRQRDFALVGKRSEKKLNLVDGHPHHTERLETAGLR